MPLMDQRSQLLGLLDKLKELSRVEQQAVTEGDFSRVEQVQDEKQLLRQRIDELEPLPDGEVSCHAAAEPVKQAVSEIMAMNQESNQLLLRRMGALKAEAETQSQTRTTLRRVQGAYARRLSPVHWEAST
ncbi:MAG: hypothetical protein CMO43_13570 [Verrucomicrobiales bacterium]|jgi:hypothetical protein|nr:hypothetical protein [Verrucomicrobiales bacterium]